MDGGDKMDWATFTGYFDWWFFIAVLILGLSALVSYWHKLSIPLLIGAIAFSSVLAVWGSDFYSIALKPTLDYFRFGGSLGLHNVGSLLYTIGFFAVIGVALINILMSDRGNARSWK